MAWLAFVLLGLACGKPNVDTVEFQINELDSSVQSMTFCGLDNEVMLALTKKRSLYRSENNGFSWRPLQTILQREGLTQLEAGKTLGQVSHIKLSPVDARLVVMIGNKGINWFSDDCGKSIWALNTGKPIYDFQFHPIRREWGLAASWTACSELAKEPCESYKELYVTKNLKDWSLVTGYVVQFSWAQDTLEPYQQRRMPDDRIYVTYIPGATGNQSIKGWTHKVSMVRSDDYFKTTVTLVPRGNKFILSSRYILVAQVIEEDSSEVQLLTSNERNFELFFKAELPIKRLSDHSYTLLDTSEESIFLFVNHIGAKAPYGNVYISDTSGRRFAISLLRNSQGTDGTCDFDKVYGLEGIYIANVYDKDIITDDSASQPRSKSPKHNKSSADSQLLKRTQITFDKGSIWHSIPAPANGSVCEDEECYLHLHSLSYRQYSPVYSTESAVGLVLGTGNVGKYLSMREDEVNTYMSRDGGLTWIEVRKGSYIYEIGDHGALIVMADNRQATDTVYYTWNEGRSWEALTFTSSPIEVENIIISPGAVAQSFLVLGIKAGKGVAVALDFSSLHEPQCQGMEDPDGRNSDYELWTPNDGRAGSKCLMGRTVSYVRRKQDAECYNGAEFERSNFKEPCTCTEDDYECDLGYYREGNAPCRPIPDAEPQARCLPGEDYYEVPTGYRRVAGNTCNSGVSFKYDPPRFPCSTGAFGVSLSTLLILLVVGGVGYGVWLRGWEVYAYVREKGLEVVKAYREPKYLSGFENEPDTVDDDMIIREPVEMRRGGERRGGREDEFNPRN